jgi:hypothetical protein
VVWVATGVGFLKSHVEDLVAEGLTAENVMDVLQEAKACDASDLQAECEEFIRTRPAEVGREGTPPQGKRFFGMRHQVTWYVPYWRRSIRGPPWLEQQSGS